MGQIIVTGSGIGAAYIAGDDRTYELRINDLGGNLNSVSAVVFDFRFWSPDLFGIEFSLSSENKIGNDGATVVSEGYRNPQEVQLIGRNNLLVGMPEEAYPFGHLQNIYKLFDALDRYRTEETYIDVVLRNSAASSTTRRLFAKPVLTKFVPSQGAHYTDGEIRIDFFVADPFFYEASPVVAVNHAASAWTQAVILYGNYFPTQRLTTKIENIDGALLSGITVEKKDYSWNTLETFSIADGISGVGDYFEVDHYYGTVNKYVSGVAIDITDKFSGSIFGLEPVGTPAFISVTCASSSGLSREFNLTTIYWRRADYDVS
jgi:hypothetical protein